MRRRQPAPTAGEFMVTCREPGCRWYDTAPSWLAALDLLSTHLETHEDGAA